MKSVILRTVISEVNVKYQPLNPRDLSNYLIPTAQAEQESAQLTWGIVTDACVQQQGSRKLRSPSTEVSPCSFLVYHTQSVLSVLTTCCKRNRQTVYKENFKICALWWQSQTIAQYVFHCIWCSWALLASSNRRGSIADKLERLPSTEDSSVWAMESCAPVTYLLPSNCNLWQVT